MEERVAIESGDERFRNIGPDVRVFHPSGADPSGTDGGVAIEAPYKLVIDVDPVVERYIRILDPGGTLITVIEFLSPANKRAPGLEDYRSKRADLLAAGVHVVEIDLVRAGNWRAVMLPERCPPEADSTYRAVVRTAGRKPAGYLFPISLRDTLPNVPIPLRFGERTANLPLQKLLDEAYEGGRYDRALDYSCEPEPSLGEDASWAHDLLTAGGKFKS